MACVRLVARHTVRRELTWSVFGAPTERRASQVFHIQCTWTDGSCTTVRRSHGELFDFQCTLLDRFPIAAGANGQARIIPFLPGKRIFARDTLALAEKRRSSVDTYVSQLVALPPDISECPQVLRFFEHDTTPPDDTPGTDGDQPRGLARMFGAKPRRSGAGEGSLGRRPLWVPRTASSATLTSCGAASQQELALSASFSQAGSASTDAIALRPLGGAAGSGGGTEPIRAVAPYDAQTAREAIVAVGLIGTLLERGDDGP